MIRMVVRSDYLELEGMIRMVARSDYRRLEGMIQMVKRSDSMYRLAGSGW
jgi:hypothetical protein